ncbi:MAG TPA: hypothetical protein VMG99_01765 [Thermoplasmata archaeon]|jgi:hypothetical protein|nr:hypothetical protein [Thermoplasmata archaeon]
MGYSMPKSPAGVRSPREERTPSIPDPTGRLEERILSALNDLHGQIAFSGLRRALGAHPESLARALRRLEREGLVERAASGYRAVAGPDADDPAPADALRPIASVDLPAGTSPESVAARLTGRWFGDLRWVGVVDRPDGRLLAWGRRDGSSPVLLGFRRGALRVYAPASRAPAADDAETEDAAYELLFRAVEAIRPAHDGRGRAMFLRSTEATGGPDPPDN